MIFSQIVMQIILLVRNLKRLTLLKSILEKKNRKRKQGRKLRPIQRKSAQGFHLLICQRATNYNNGPLNACWKLKKKRAESRPLRSSVKTKRESNCDGFVQKKFLPPVDSCSPLFSRLKQEIGVEWLREKKPK